MANAIYAFIVESSQKKNPDELLIVYDGKIGFIEVFALFLAAIVAYRVSFGLIHIFKFKLLNKTAKFSVP